MSPVGGARRCNARRARFCTPPVHRICVECAIAVLSTSKVHFPTGALEAISIVQSWYTPTTPRRYLSPSVVQIKCRLARHDPKACASLLQIGLSAHDALLAPDQRSSRLPLLHHIDWFPTRFSLALFLSLGSTAGYLHTSLHTCSKRTLQHYGRHYLSPRAHHYGQGDGVGHQGRPCRESARA
jgi:hypothetical protein